jgi:hypothetical protein
MNDQIDAQLVIDELLEQLKQANGTIALLRAALRQANQDKQAEAEQ